MGDIASAFADVVAYLEERAEETMYGYGCTENPHDFTPDDEVCTAAELEAHRLACEAYDRGDPVDRSFTPAGAIVDAASGEVIKPLCGSPWGMGTYVIRDPEIDAAIRVLRDVMTSHNLVDPEPRDA